MIVHFQNIAHRDLKPDNILVDKENRIKIVDFGVSEMFQGGKDSMRKSAGSPSFMSPEMCSAKGASEGASLLKADVWAMGVVLYCMVTGHVPFRAETVFATYELIRTEDPIFPNNIDPDLSDLLLKLLTKDPNSRITIPEVKVHPWVTENGKSPLPSSEENCKDRVAVTEEEKQNSITKFGSVSGLFTVIKAVNRFRSLSQSHQRENSK